VTHRKHVSGRFRAVRLPLRTGWLLVAAIATLSGCGSRGPLETPGPALSRTVAELPEVALPEVRMPPPSRADVMAAYRTIYGAVPDPKDNLAVGKRLADLEMQVGEDKDQAGEADPYRAAIDLYEDLLDSEGVDGRDEVLYQLARAHDVVGDGQATRKYLDRLIAEYPGSAYEVEARFRRAEMAFSAEQYRDAAGDYAFVVERGGESIYWRNANYMLGWCRFKTGDLETSLESFFVVVGDVLAGDAAPDRGAQELLDDALRVVVLGVTDLDGPATLAAHMDRLGRPDWQHRVYERLAAEYATRERYLDSVAALEAFIEHNPLDRRAPVFHQRAIDTLIAADFPSEIRPRKEDFVTRYGPRSEFWQLHAAESRAEYLPILKTYVVELSHLVHSEAQKSGEPSKFLVAADYYQQFVEAFPDDPAVAENLFLLGEVYTEAKRPGDAVAAYQRVVREHPDYARANEAGYAAILGLTEVLASVGESERELWQRVRIDAQIEFAMTFPGDDRAAAVEADAANALFRLNDYGEAMELASHLIRSRPELDPTLARSAYLILGHGHFELADFAGAEQDYRALLALPDTGESNAEVEQKLLAAIYRQAEAAEAAGAADVAVTHYLRIADEAPDSELAAKGHYDAVAVVEGQGRWADAAALLDDFRSRYPGSDLGRDAGARLAGLYEQSQDWRGAAAEFRGIADADGDAEVKRQALYRAGELYLQVDDVPNAITAFADYVNRYPVPADVALESVHQLDQLSQRTGDGAERRRWLAKKVEIADREGASATDRMKFMAAEAQFVFAEDARAEFDAVAIRAPLAQSIQHKTAALKRSVSAYEKVANYGVAQFASASTFQIADIYAALSRALMDSERPAGLSEMEREQYDILLEEQAYPFEEQAIAIHEINVERSWSGVYDEWVQRSFAALKALVPARFDREEVEVSYVDTIH
jgi:TolA-binding protein